MVVDNLLEGNCPSDISIKDYILENFTPAKLAEETLELEFEAESKTSTYQEHGQQQCYNLVFPFARTSTASLPIKDARELVPQSNGTKKVVELTLALEGILNNDLEPGDTIGILTSNAENEVRFVLEAMRFQDKADMYCRVRLRSGCVKKTAKVPAYIPPLTTPYDILRDCLSLRAVPKKQFLRALAEYCSDSLEKQFFSCLSSREGAHLYNELILEKALTFIDLLRLCSSCCPSIALIVEHLPRLMPRPYSIASSPLTSRNEVKIIFSILPEKPGVCTQMLNTLSEEFLEGSSDQQQMVRLYFRETNKFRYTREEINSGGSILIGVGTGVAPFLGFLEHKWLLSETSKADVLNETWLFSGNKTQESAFGRSRFQEFNAKNILNRYFEAFSQDPDSSAKYVQDLFMANLKEFVEFLMKPETNLYICADGAQISKSIEDGIKNCLMEALAYDASQACEIIKEFRKTGKYREDLWV